MKPTRNQISRYIKRKLIASIRGKAAALLLISFFLVAEKARAIPLALGPDQITSSLAVNVKAFQQGNQPASDFSIALEFDKPIYIRTGEVVLACTVFWQTSWTEAFSQISSNASYLLDSKGDWQAFDRPEIDISPFGAMWLKLYVDQPLALYGVRYDWHIPKLYFGTPALWVRSNVQPFQVGGTNSLPDNDTTLILLSSALVGLLFVRKKV
jgi:hypothetical protein